jgi:hypothetical protein
MKMTTALTTVSINVASAFLKPNAALTKLDINKKTASNLNLLFAIDFCNCFFETFP